MRARPIDANTVKRRLQKWQQAAKNKGDKVGAAAYADCMSLIDHTPTCEMTDAQDVPKWQKGHPEHDAYVAAMVRDKKGEYYWVKSRHTEDGWTTKAEVVAWMDVILKRVD